MVVLLKYAVSEEVQLLKTSFYYKGGIKKEACLDMILNHLKTTLKTPWITHQNHPHFWPLKTPLFDLSKNTQKTKKIGLFIPTGENLKYDPKTTTFLKSPFFANSWNIGLKLFCQK